MTNKTRLEPPLFFSISCASFPDFVLGDARPPGMVTLEHFMLCNGFALSCVYCMVLYVLFGYCSSFFLSALFFFFSLLANSVHVISKTASM